MQQPSCECTVKAKLGVARTFLSVPAPTEMSVPPQNSSLGGAPGQVLFAQRFQHHIGDEAIACLIQVNAVGRENTAVLVVGVALLDMVDEGLPQIAKRRLRS